MEPQKYIAMAKRYFESKPLMPLSQESRQEVPEPLSKKYIEYKPPMTVSQEKSIRKELVTFFRLEGYYKWTDPHSNYVFLCRCRECLEKELKYNIEEHKGNRYSEVADVKDGVDIYTFPSVELMEKYVQIDPITGDTLKESDLQWLGSLYLVQVNYNEHKKKKNPLLDFS
jgi:hypothetical protein